jgi:UDP-N-acetyl-D-mannosaminuronic acid transferase (WecB/TagA/CpsF family)
MNVRILNFKGIKFYEADYNYIINGLKKKGGYLVIPAASAMVEAIKNKKKFNALKKSTYAIFDSGFFCFCLSLTKFEYFKKFSGYKFLKSFINDNKNKNKKILSLDSSIIDLELNQKFLTKKGFKLIKNYLCPFYSKNKIIDKKLIKIINRYKPEFIISNIGGGTQESLALYILSKINFKSSIICSGAALAFLTGAQAPITDIIDKLYLGWLTRLAYNPRLYFFRIMKSFGLFKIVLFTKIKILNTTN